MAYTLRRGLLNTRTELPSKNTIQPIISCLGTNSASVSESDQLLCGICSLNLKDIDLRQRGEHYEGHFLSEAQDIICLTPSPKKFSPSKNLNKLSPIKTWTFNTKQSLEDHSDVFWYASQSASPPSNYTPGIIPLLKKSLWNSHAQGSTCRAALCFERVVHISRDLGDIGWGCGYRNFLMACAALMEQSSQPSYFPLLDSPIGPGIRNLQSWIEAAWNDGFDPCGAKELKKLVGTRKWIGTADLWVAFSFRGIPAELVDFDLKNQPTGFKIVADWIVDYFTPKPSTNKPASLNEALRGASPIVITDKMPIILQYNGHSQTIVGYEVSSKGHIRLLTFDPAHVLDKNTRNSAISLFNTSPKNHPSLPPITSQSQKRRQASSPFNSTPHNTTKRLKYDGAGSVGNFGEGILATPEHRQKRRWGPKAARDTQDGISDQALNRLRIDTKKYGKKHYQILYFPMTAPLTTQERMRKKEVTSTRVC